MQNVRLSLCWKTINGSQRFDWFMTVPPFYTTVSHIAFFSCPKNNIVYFFRYFLFLLIHRTFGSVHNFGYQTRWVIQVRIRNQNFNGHWQSIKCKISNYIWKLFIYLYTGTTARCDIVWHSEKRSLGGFVIFCNVYSSLLSQLDRENLSHGIIHNRWEMGSNLDPWPCLCLCPQSMST